MVPRALEIYPKRTQKTDQRLLLRRARHGFCLLFRLNAFDDSQIPLDPQQTRVNLRTVNCCYIRILFRRDRLLKAFADTPQKLMTSRWTTDEAYFHNIFEHTVWILWRNIQ